MIYDFMTYEVMTYAVMTYDVISFDVMTHEVMTQCCHDFMTYEKMKFFHRQIFGGLKIPQNAMICDLIKFHKCRSSVKKSSKLLSFKRYKGCLCIPIGCNSVRTFVLANRNTETTLYFVYFVEICFKDAVVNMNK